MKNKNDKSNDPTLKQASPNYLHPTDTGLKIVSTTFDGVGFKGWKKAVTIALFGKNRLGFLDGSIKRSTSNEVYAKACDRVNDIVIGWFLSAMSDKIAQSVLWIKTTRGIWDELEQRFGQSSSAQLFTVQEALTKVIQGSEMSIEDFFTKMKGLWDEIDAFDPLLFALVQAAYVTCNISE